MIKKFESFQNDNHPRLVGKYIQAHINFYANMDLDDNVDISLIERELRRGVENLSERAVDEILELFSSVHCLPCIDTLYDRMDRELSNWCSSEDFEDFDIEEYLRSI